MDQFDEIYAALPNSGVDMPPVVCLTPTMEQQLRLERVRRELDDVKRADLEELLLNYIRMTFILQNNLSQVFKWASGKKQKSD
jgi:hypothetical protein